MKKIPKPTVNRLSLYLKCFSELEDSNVEYVSSEELATLIGLNPAQVRKDLTYFGKFGKQGLGYNISEMKQTLSNILGTHKTWNVGVIGVGNLGSALLMYGGFKPRGFKIVAGFDISEDKIGWEIDGVKIYDIAEINEIVKKEKIEIIILTVPKEAVSSVMNILRKTNIKGVLNFARVHLKSDNKILVRNVDLALEMEQLSFFITNKLF